MKNVKSTSKPLALYAAVSMVAVAASMGSMAAPAWAQGASCSVTVNNKVNDNVNVTAVLSTTDPNENGEGESLMLSSPGGFSGSTSTYAIPQVYDYTARVANDTISGFITGSDGDEFCSIQAKVTPVSAKDKQTAATVAAAAGTVSAALGYIAAACASNVVTGVFCSLPFAAVAAAEATLAGLMSFIAADPVDNNYTHLASPVFTHVKPSFGPGLPGSVRENTERLLRVQQRELGYTGALYTTLNREGTAYDGGATQYVTLQADYAAQLKSRIAALAAIDIRLRKQLSFSLTQAGLDANITPGAVLQFEQTLASNGLSATMVSNLAAFGATDPSLLSLITNILVVQDINAVAGSVDATISSPAVINSLSQAVAQYGGACSAIDFVRSALGTKKGDPGYIASADLNGDGVVNGEDLELALKRAPDGAHCSFDDDEFGDRR